MDTNYEWGAHSEERTHQWNLLEYSCRSETRDCSWTSTLQLRLFDFVISTKGHKLWVCHGIQEINKLRSRIWFGDTVRLHSLWTWTLHTCIEESYLPRWKLKDRSNRRFIIYIYAVYSNFVIYTVHAVHYSTSFIVSILSSLAKNGWGFSFVHCTRQVGSMRSVHCPESRRVRSWGVGLLLVLL